MSRDDLTRHTEQMRSFLQKEPAASAAIIAAATASTTSVPDATATTTPTTNRRLNDASFPGYYTLPGVASSSPFATPTRPGGPVQGGGAVRHAYGRRPPPRREGGRMGRGRDQSAWQTPAHDRSTGLSFVLQAQRRDLHVRLHCWRDDLRLYINGNLQFSSRDEHRYPAQCRLLVGELVAALTIRYDTGGQRRFRPDRVRC